MGRFLTRQLPAFDATRLIIGRTSGALIDLVFPVRCQLCLGSLASVQRESDGGRSRLPFCLNCRSAIQQDCGEPACPRCGANVSPFEVADGLCRTCRIRPPRVLGTARVGAYGPALRQLIRAYKYRGREEIGPILGGWLTCEIQRSTWFERVQALVAVPTHWRRRLTRPFHAAEALAKCVSRRTGLPDVPVLRRVRAGPRQVGLSHAARAANVRGAFAVHRGTSLRRARLLLIDDVKTSGATLDECAKVLRRAGAAEVYAAVITRADLARRTAV